nr:MFS transporter [uncultured Roseateles sp.]
MGKRFQDFHRVLAAESVSNFGAMLSRLAIPWLATLGLDATPLQMGWLLVADVLAGAIGGLLLGAWIDARGKRRVMLVADVLRAVVLAGLSALAWLQQLSLALLVASAAANGLLTVAFEMARSAWMAQRIADADLTRANAQLAVGTSLSETLAFALGGWLYQGLGVVLALMVDALSYLASALCLRGLREAPAAAPAEPKMSAWRQWRDDTAAGLALLWTDTRLRLLAAIELLVALAMSLAGTSYMIFVTRELGFSTGEQGLIFATGGLGALLGAGLALRLGRHLGAGLSMAAGLGLCALGSACTPLAAGAGLGAAVLLVTQQIVGDAGQTVHQIHERTLRQTLVPQALLARVDGGLRSLGQGATLLGALGGGGLASVWGTRMALWGVVLLMGIAALLAWRGLAGVRSPQA